jgi:hypothetical protein
MVYIGGGGSAVAVVTVAVTLVSSCQQEGLEQATCIYFPAVLDLPC